MKCRECGGTYQHIFGVLDLDHISVPNVHYEQCDKCGGRLLPLRTLEAWEWERHWTLAQAAMWGHQ